MINILFTRRHHVGSLAIRLVTWSDWSHVDLILGDEVIGATAGEGVAVSPLRERLAHASEAAVVTFQCQRPEALVAAMRSQIGKPYDWLGCAGIALRNRDWQEDDCWFCSELLAWAFSHIGEPLFRPDEIARITPQHLWMLDNPTLKFDAPLELVGGAE